MGVFAGYIFILLSVAFLYLFVCVDEHGKGYLAKTKILFWQTIPNMFRSIAKKCCGETFVRLIDRLIKYICNERNPFVQILYCVCAFGGFYVYVTEGFPNIPNKRLDAYHMYIGTAIMMLCYASYFMACSVDPGQLDRDTEKSQLVRANKRFKYDGVIFEKNKKCSTCKIDKPPRSKHCAMCGFCVEKFDHHCVWINQCVGLHNYKYFLSFLFLHAVVCTYGVLAGYQILMAKVEDQKLYQMTFKTADGEQFEATNYIVFKFL